MKRIDPIKVPDKCRELALSDGGEDQEFSTYSALAGDLTTMPTALTVLRFCIRASKPY